MNALGWIVLIVLIPVLIWLCAGFGSLVLTILGTLLYAVTGIG